MLDDILKCIGKNGEVLDLETFKEKTKGDIFTRVWALMKVASRSRCANIPDDDRYGTSFSENNQRPSSRPLT